MCRHRHTAPHNRHASSSKQLQISISMCTWMHSINHKTAAALGAMQELKQSAFCSTPTRPHSQQHRSLKTPSIRLSPDASLSQASVMLAKPKQAQVQEPPLFLRYCKALACISRSTQAYNPDQRKPAANPTTPTAQHSHDAYD